MKIDSSMIAIIINYARKHRNELHITSIDVEKAFPSISHYAIFRALERRGFPRDFTEFVKNMYSKSTTVMEINGESSENIIVKRGVR